MFIFAGRLGLPSAGRHTPRGSCAQNCFPDILCVIQVALEGEISRASAQTALAAGQLPQGDLLPWMVGQQFQDTEFPSLSGARIVRIASHPGLLKAGYGTRAMKELQRYYEGLVSGMVSGDGCDVGHGGGGGGVLR